MTRKIIILNLVVLAMLVLGGMKLRADWRAFGPVHDVAKIQPAPQTFPPLAASVAAPPAAADWTEIPSRNVFSFDRSDIDIAPVVEVVAEPPKPSGPKPILFGTSIIGKQKMAYLGSGATGNRSYKPLEVGQEIDTWKILDIALNTIEIESNGVKATVKINDPVAQVPRDGGKTGLASASPTVIHTNAPTAAATPAVINNITAPPPAANVLNGFSVSQAPTIILQPGEVPRQTLFGQSPSAQGAKQ